MNSAAIRLLQSSKKFFSPLPSDVASAEAFLKEYSSEAFGIAVDLLRDLFCQKDSETDFTTAIGHINTVLQTTKPFYAAVLVTVLRELTAKAKHSTDGSLQSKIAELRAIIHKAGYSVSNTRTELIIFDSTTYSCTVQGADMK